MLVPKKLDMYCVSSACECCAAHVPAAARKSPDVTPETKLILSITSVFLEVSKNPIFRASVK